MPRYVTSDTNLLLEEHGQKRIIKIVASRASVDEIIGFVHQWEKKAALNLVLVGESKAALVRKPP